MRIIICLVLIATIASCQNTSSPSKEELMLDSTIRHHISVLDSLNKEGVYTTQGSQSITFLEEITGIQSQAEIDFLGKVRFTEEDLNNWKDWYEENKGSLVEMSKSQ